MITPLWRIMEKRRVGRPPKFETPADLLAAAQEYFQWAEDNPYIEDKVVVAGGAPEHVGIKKIQALTITAMRLYVGMDKATWSKYCNDPEFSNVCEYIVDYIRDEKFRAAAAGQLHPVLVARDLGLVERSEVVNRVSLIESDMPLRDAVEAYQGLLDDNS